MVRIIIPLVLICSISRLFGQTDSSAKVLAKQYFFNTDENFSPNFKFDNLDSIRYQYGSQKGKIRLPSLNYDQLQKIKSSEILDEFYKATSILDVRLLEPFKEGFSVYYLGDILLKKGITTKLFLIVFGTFGKSDPFNRVVLGLNFYQGKISSVIELAESQYIVGFSTSFYSEHKCGQVKLYLNKPSDITGKIKYKAPIIKCTKIDKQGKLR